MTSSILFRVDTAGLALSRPLVLSATSALGRRVELTHLSLRGPGRWVGYDVRAPSLIDIVERDGALVAVPNAAGLPELPQVSLVPRPIGFTIEPRWGQRLVAWTGNKPAASGVFVSDPDQAGGFGRLRLFRGSGPPEDAVGLRAWPPDAQTLAVLATGREGKREATLRLLEQVPGEDRVRYRPESWALGEGAIGRRTIVDPRGRLVALLAWQSRVVVVAPRALAGP